MRLATRRPWLSIVFLLSAACGLLTARFVQGDSGGNMSCYGTGQACLDCESTSDQERPYYCDIGGAPPPLIAGTCLEGPGYCGNWASYRCGAAIECSSVEDTGVDCGFLQFCDGW